MKNCILCGKPHEQGKPCDFTGADSLLAGKITIPPKEETNIAGQPHFAKDYKGNAYGRNYKS